VLSHEARYPLERMHQIEQDRRDEEERARAAAAGEPRPGYGVQAALFGDEAAATETLTRLIDAGYDGTLVTSEREGNVFYEVRLGPYESYEKAQEAADVIRRAYGLAPSVLVETPEAGPR
jgi:cell division septation protein DedD